MKLPILCQPEVIALIDDLGLEPGRPPLWFKQMLRHKYRDSGVSSVPKKTAARTLLEMYQYRNHHRNVLISDSDYTYECGRLFED